MYLMGPMMHVSMLMHMNMPYDASFILQRAMYLYSLFRALERKIKRGTKGHLDTKRGPLGIPEYLSRTLVHLKILKTP